MNTIKIGDTVKPSDSTEDSLPAWRDMRGTVVWIDAKSPEWIRVHWHCDRTPDDNPRHASTVSVV